MLTPIPRRRPWQLARQTASLDRLSNGRLILSVGLGDPAEWEYGFFGEETDAKIRAQKLDEGLDIITGLWSGDYFRYHGHHYQLEEMRFFAHAGADTPYSHLGRRLLAAETAVSPRRPL